MRLPRYGGGPEDVYSEAMGGTPTKEETTDFRTTHSATSRSGQRLERSIALWGVLREAQETIRAREHCHWLEEARMNQRTAIHGIVLSLIVAVTGQAVIFSEATQIGVDDYTYDDADVIVDGCTLTIDGCGHQ